MHTAGSQKLPAVYLCREFSLSAFIAASYQEHVNCLNTLPTYQQKLNTLVWHHF